MNGSRLIRGYGFYAISILTFFIGIAFLFTYILPRVGFHDDITSSMRGDQIMIVQVSDLKQQITVWDDGEARRFYVQPSNNHNVSIVHLDSGILNSLKIIQHSWCDEAPRNIADKNKIIYHIGINCGMFRREHFVVYKDKMPLQILDLLRQVPPPGNQ